MSEDSGDLDDRALRRLLDLAAAADDGDSEGDGRDDELAAPPPLPARYEVRRVLGRGGMGVVYEAFDRQLGRRCAVKTLASSHVGEELRRRFAREALAAARLVHPNIAAVHDATPDFLVMQLVDGGPIDEAGGDLRRIVGWIRDAAAAVHHAHEQGIVHRDLKPSNLLVEGDRVFVVDFGLAKELGGDPALSLAGGLLGTPAFMAPEQARGDGAAVSARTDVWALGATLRHCIAGAPPFAHGDLPALLRAIVEDEPQPTGIDRDLDLVVGKCLAKEPERRYASAAAFAADLDRWLQKEPVHARRPSAGYRLRKFVERQRRALRYAAFAGLAAGVLTAAVLVPIALRESAARTAASAAVQLADHAAAVLQDAAMFQRLGDLESARQALQGAVERTRAFLQEHEVPRVRYLLGRLLRARGDFDGARTELERALAGDPGLVEARYERGLVLAARRDLGADDRALAIADLGVPLPATPVTTDVDRLFGSAERLRLQGRSEEAMAMLAEVLEHDPMHVAARVSLSRAALALGQDDVAGYYAASAVDVQAGYGPIYVARERQRLPTTMLGLDAALVDFLDDVRDGPDLAIACAHRGLVQLRRALRLDRENERAEALQTARLAVLDHDATLQVHPDLAGACNNRAVCLLEVARLAAATGDGAAAANARRDAQADLDRATRLAPTLAAAHYNRGVLAATEYELLSGLGRAEPARRSIERARLAFATALRSAGDGWPHQRACRERLAAAEAAAAQLR